MLTLSGILIKVRYAYTDLGARLGIEPRLLGNESSVLPLDDPAIWLRRLESNQFPKDNETRDLTACPHRNIHFFFPNSVHILTMVGVALVTGRRVTGLEESTTNPFS